MVHVGKFNELEVVKEFDFGIYLRKEDVEILMPSKWIPGGTKIGDKLNVFVFRDSDDRLIATSQTPLATADTFAYLEVKQVNETGAFMDWGMDKDLLIPYREQAQPMVAGRSYVVFVYLDELTDRLVGSSKLSRFIIREDIELQEGDVVDLLVYSETNLGYNAIINDLYSGLIYKNEIYENIRIGDKLQGYVKKLREDNKIDLSLQKSGFELVDDVKWKILKVIKEQNGFLAMRDDSSPEEIKAKFQISKKAFKKAIGALYKERLVKLTDKGIELL
jgi:predicted RNA-binding protein (virulence factor B family)